MNVLNKQMRIRFRKKRVRSKLHGTAALPRVSVFTSNQGMFVQFIDDDKKATLLSARDSVIKKKGTKTERAHALGTHLAKQALEAGITSVVFDRGAKQYHGRVKALADALREGGMQF